MAPGQRLDDLAAGVSVTGIVAIGREHAIEVAAPEHLAKVRLQRRPFEGRSEDFVFEVTSVNFTWSALWERAQGPTRW